ncbi:hypothetical protein MKW92_001531 [Papaver armeniacum]|nr:hypothetical protein MKW92_001531 [Papaver armeniacum]
MILKSFLLGNLLSLCMKIINSVATVVVRLYYGFLTTFSIGPSYLFLLRARVIKERTEKEVSETTIYYAPLHLALGRPHTINVLVLSYLLFHFFWNNHKNFYDYGSTTRHSMRNLSIQCVFLNDLIFQLFNHFILPSSTLSRLVNIYMFRCNNKMFFVTSSFVGWLIGHILFMKWKLKEETSETEERGESEGETDVEIETISETNRTKQEKGSIEEGSIEEDPSPSLYSEENSKLKILKLKEDKDLLWFEKPLRRNVTPFFFTCESDGKERISFTYPPSFSIYLEMIKGKILLSTTEKPSFEEFLNMIEAFLEEGWIWINKFHNILPTNYQGLKLNSENRTKYLFDVVTADRHHQRIIKESIGIKEIRKEVPQWSYKLITSLDQQDGTILEETAEDHHEIRSRKDNHVVIFKYTERKNSTMNTNDEVEEVHVYIFKGSMRAHRRKTCIWEPFQTNIHSPFFLDKIYKKVFFFFEEEAKEKDKKRKKKGEENDRLAMAERLGSCLRVLKEKTKGFLKDSKEKESWTHQKDFFQKKRIKELGKVNPILLVGLRKVYESIVHESSSQIRSMSWTNNSLTEKKKDLADRTKKNFLIPDRNINPNDTSCNDKILKAPKNFWRIFQRRSARLIRKRHSFLNFLIEKIYMDTLLYLINIPRINTQFSLDLKKKKKKKEIDKKNNKNLHHFCTPIDLLSQAYPIIKLSKTAIFIIFFSPIQLLFNRNLSQLLNRKHFPL